jgi:hypothetical protein
LISFKISHDSLFSSFADPKQSHAYKDDAKESVQSMEGEQPLAFTDVSLSD